MARFNAAKMIGATDLAFQRKFNQLINLLDTGYHVQTTLDGEKITIKVDPKVGLAFYQNDVYKGGLELIDGELALITDILKSPNNQYTYIKFEASRLYKLTERYAGLTNFYATDDNFSEGTSCLHLSIAGYIQPDGSITEFNFTDRLGGKAYFNTFTGDYGGATGGVWTEFEGGDSDNNHLTLATTLAADVLLVRLGMVGGVAVMNFDINNNHAMQLKAATSELLCVAAPTNAIGVDATGAYKITGGVKAYL